MTDLQQAAQQALEALETLSKLGNGNSDGNSIGNTIAQDARTALRETLAQPEQRKPLTRDEISEIAAQSGAYDEQLLAFARAIEAAHNIKEGT